MKVWHWDSSLELRALYVVTDSGCLFVCGSHFSRTVHLISFTLVMCIVKGSMKYNVDCGGILAHYLFNMNKLWLNRRPALDSSCSWDSSMCVMLIMRTTRSQLQLILQFRVQFRPSKQPSSNRLVYIRHCTSVQNVNNFILYWSFLLT